MSSRRQEIGTGLADECFHGKRDFQWAVELAEINNVRKDPSITTIATKARAGDDWYMYSRHGMTLVRFSSGRGFLF